MQEVVAVITSQLCSINQKDPDGELVETWLRDLQHRLGAIAPDRLAAAFVVARDDCAERRARGAFGQLSLDDVIRHYRRAPAEAESIPQDPHCPHACDRGNALMTDPKLPTYDVLGPCSCRAGEHLRAKRAAFEGKRNVEELLRFGWRLKPRPAPLSQEDTRWLMARTFETSIQHALWEHREGRRSDPSDENMDRAAKILSRSIGRG